MLLLLEGGRIVSSLSSSSFGDDTPGPTVIPIVPWEMMGEGEVLDLPPPAPAEEILSIPIITDLGEPLPSPYVDSLCCCC